MILSARKWTEELLFATRRIEPSRWGWRDWSGYCPVWFCVSCGRIVRDRQALDDEGICMSTAGIPSCTAAILAWAAREGVLGSNPSGNWKQTPAWADAVARWLAGVKWVRTNLGLRRIEQGFWISAEWAVAMDVAIYGASD